uniref:Phosphoribosylglycinamide synthetase C-domain domain-containing protein n=1 Tax=Ditylenchus dipsaci TaxID=166011 RepID=A0A915DW85_9BILA
MVPTFTKDKHFNYKFNLDQHYFPENLLKTTVKIASQGYPAKVFPTNLSITDIPEDDDHTATFYAGAKHRPDGQLVSCGGRVLCVTSLASSPFQAKSLCLKAVESIQFPAKHYRRDIGDFVLLPRSQLSYAKSGVNISEGNAFVDKIQKFCGRTLTPGTKQIGGFGALVDLQKEGFQSPQLVIGMDGVGTKIELAQQSGHLKWLGYDLVGMCVNDVLCHGAKPIAFLDYYVTGKLIKEEAVQVSNPRRLFGSATGEKK